MAADKRGVKFTTCDALVEDAQGRPIPCGRRDVCIRVIVQNGAGQTQLKRWVCRPCGKRMNLPDDHGVVMTPHGTRPYVG